MGLLVEGTAAPCESEVFEDRRFGLLDFFVPPWFGSIFAPRSRKKGYVEVLTIIKGFISDVFLSGQ